MAAPTRSAPDRIGAWLERAEHIWPACALGITGGGGMLIGLVAGAWFKAGLLAVVTAVSVWLWLRLVGVVR